MLRCRENCLEFDGSLNQAMKILCLEFRLQDEFYLNDYYFDFAQNYFSTNYKERQFTIFFLMIRSLFKVVVKFVQDAKDKENQFCIAIAKLLQALRFRQSFELNLNEFLKLVLL